MQTYFPSLRTSVIAMLTAVGMTAAQAGYLLEIDTDGLDDGVLTYNPHFSFGADTTTASQSATSTAFGMTGGDSIFGGDGNLFPDTYLYDYDPGVAGDNLLIPGGTDLGYGNLASGIPAGAPGIYAVYATWPFTQNVSGGLTTFEAITDGDSFIVSIDQNNGGDGYGNAWIKLGELNWTSGNIRLSQQADSNSFVSMRSAGVLFEPIPEPTVFALAGLGLLSLTVRRRIAAR